MREVPTRPVSPAQSKVQAHEKRLRFIVEKAAPWINAAEAELEGLRAMQRDACAELETKIKLAQEAVEQAREGLVQAVKHLRACQTDLRARTVMNMEAISAVEERRRKIYSQVAARVQAAQEMVDETCEEEMTLETSSTGEAA